MSDVESRGGEVPAEVRSEHAAMGRLHRRSALGTITEYVGETGDGGAFEGIEIEPTRVYNIEDAADFPRAGRVSMSTLSRHRFEGKFHERFHSRR